MSRKIYNEIVLIWNEETNSYDTISEDSFHYDGDIYNMAEGEIEVTGGSTAKEALNKVAKAARTVRKAFHGANKASLENVDILKLLTKATDGEIKNVKTLVKDNKKKIEQMLKLKSLNEFEKKAKKELSNANKELIKNHKDTVKQTKKIIEQERKLKAVNIKREFKRQADARKKELAAAKKQVAQAKKERKTRISAVRVLKRLNNQLKAQGGSLKKLKIPQKTYQAALKGNKLALDEVTRATKRLILTGKVHDKEVKGFNVRNHRNTMTLSRARSTLLMMAFAYNSLLKPIMSLITANALQEKSEESVAAALRSTAGASNMTQKEILNQAAAIEDLTGVGDELVLGSSALLLTFTNIGRNVFPDAQKSIVDLASAMNGGKVSVEGLKSATILVGKALNDPLKGLSALTRVGIQFTEQQKAQIKTYSELGDSEKAQAVILGELNTQYGGFAEAIRHTHEGRMMALNSAVGTLSEQFGKALAPALAGITERMISLAKWLDAEKITAFAVGLGAAVAVFKTYDQITGGLIKKKKIMASIEAALLVIRQGAGKAALTLLAAVGASTATLWAWKEKEIDKEEEAEDAILKKAKADKQAFKNKIDMLAKIDQSEKASISSLTEKLALERAGSEVEKYAIEQKRELIQEEINLIEALHQEKEAKKLLKDIESSEEGLQKKIDIALAVSEVEKYRIEQGRELTDLEIARINTLESIKKEKEDELAATKKMKEIEKQRLDQIKLRQSIESSELGLSNEITLLELKKADASDLEIARAELKIEKAKRMAAIEKEILAMEAAAEGMTGAELDTQIELVNQKNNELALLYKIFQIKDDIAKIDSESGDKQKKKDEQLQFEQEMFDLKVQFAQETLSAISEINSRQKQMVDEQMASDVERTKQSLEYKLASK